jgi:hypothetical protein
LRILKDIKGKVEERERERKRRGRYESTPFLKRARTKAGQGIARRSFFTTCTMGAYSPLTKSPVESRMLTHRRLLASGETLQAWHAGKNREPSSRGK